MSEFGLWLNRRLGWEGGGLRSLQWPILQLLWGGASGGCCCWSCNQSVDVQRCTLHWPLMLPNLLLWNRLDWQSWHDVHTIHPSYRFLLLRSDTASAENRLIRQTHTDMPCALYINRKWRNIRSGKSSRYRYTATWMTVLQIAQVTTAPSTTCISSCHHRCTLNTSSLP